MRRADNPLFFPESHFDATFGRYFFYALGHGAIGFSPFGIDRSMTAGDSESAGNHRLRQGSSV